jgi:hypothetical protein
MVARCTRTPARSAGARVHRDGQTYDQQLPRAGRGAGHPAGVLLATSASRKINSIHHQSIKDLAPGFAVEARCPDDGVIEAIRHTGDAWVAAVQWHPEFHKPEYGVLDDTPLLNDFLAAAARAARQRNMTQLAIHNPANGQLITTLPADARVGGRQGRRARAAQPAWAAVPLAQRKACIEKFRAGVVRDLESLAATMTRETGKPIRCRATSSMACWGASTFFLIQVDLAHWRPRPCSMTGA